MRNDARPIGEEFRDIADHGEDIEQSDRSGEKDRDPAEGSRDAVNLANNDPKGDGRAS